MPGEAVLVDLAEVDDLDVGQRALAVRAEHVIVGQPGERLAPPGRVAQPADDRGERQDRRPGLQRRPLDPPDLAPREEPAEQRDGRARPASGIARITPGQSLAGRWMNRFVIFGRRKLPLEELDLLERQRQRGQHRAGRDQAVDPVRSRRPRARPARAGPRRARQQREQDHHRAPSSRRTPGPAGCRRATRQRRASGSYSPFQNARAVAAQSRRPGVSVSIRCAWP